MKRISILLLALLLTAGCLSKSQSQGEGADKPAPQDKPPALTVVSGESQTQATLSTYSWSWPNPDGTSTGVEADGLHPLDMMDLLTPLLPEEGQPLTLRFELGALTLLPASRETLVDGARVELTAMEYELLHYLARHPGTALTRARLLREVWGYNSDDDPSRTVDSHVKTLRLKLGDDADSPRFIQTVRGTGYRLIAGEKG